MTIFAHQLATQNPACCRPDANLATAASLLWECDCGLLPVVDDERQVIGVLTDRDICIALATRNKPAGEVLVRDVMRAPVHTLRQDQTAAHALRLMRQQRVRRLPVVDLHGRLEAVLSLNDLVLAAQASGALPAPDVSHDEVMATLQAICAHASSAIKEMAKVEQFAL